MICYFRNGHNIRSRAYVLGMVTMASTKQLEEKDFPGACFVCYDIAEDTQKQLQRWLQCLKILHFAITLVAL